MPDNRRNLQINQPGIQGNVQVDQNGWPVPLNDPSDPLKMVVTNGSNGEQTNKDLVSTSQQRNGEHHLAEGSSGSATTVAEQGGHGNKLQTSQQNNRDHSTPESERRQ